MLGDLPPSSRLTRARWSAASFITRMPVAVDPVNATLPTPGWRTSGPPVPEPKPVTTLKTPGGNPASAKSLANSSVDAGVCSEGLTTKVERLKKHKGEYRHPDKVAAGAMQAGTPVMESAITMITNDHFYYRGHDALLLATTHSVEQVASLIWTGDISKEHSLFLRTPPESMLARYQKIRFHLNGLTPLEAFQVCLPLAALDDIAAYDLRAEAVAQTGARILQLLAAVAADGRHTTHGIAQTVQQGWVPRDERAIALLTAALILCAD